MRKEHHIKTIDLRSVLRNCEVKGLEPVSLLNSNSEVTMLALGSVSEYSSSGQGSWDGLSRYVSETQDWLFGHLAYDLKNDLEDLSSSNADFHYAPDVHFFQPEVVLRSASDGWRALVHPDAHLDEDLFADPKEIYSNGHGPIDLRPSISKEEYIDRINSLKSHIQLGDIYEVNFCQEFSVTADVDPLALYWTLNDLTLAPFSTYYKVGPHHLISGSPERFLRRTGEEVISQPIKGTAKRSSDPIIDQAILEELITSEKEQAENTMIVDLVRNDLSRVARKGSVVVKELCGPHSFKTVHHLISTICCTVDEQADPIEIMKSAFPMGSMTGAPKIRAMQLIEEHEDFKRGMYSGSVGYIDPSGNFDLNVVIRSLLYNEDSNYLSCPVGGAITAKSDPVSEYEESLLKAEAMMKAVQQHA